MNTAPFTSIRSGSPPRIVPPLAESSQQTGHTRPMTRGRAQRLRGRRRVDAARLAGITIHLPENTSTRFRKTRGLIVVSALPLLASLVWFPWWHRYSTPPEPESIFRFEESPLESTPQASPDPSPPPPKPVPEPVPEESPPPQFGLQEEQLSETGELAVATGNTLMTEADSVVKEPVETLPAVPQLVDQAPRILKGRPPEYPVRALERGLEATVVVLITIDTLGRVTQVDIERGGGRDFDPEVVRAVKKLVFQPPVRGGKRLAARFRQPYEFRLE